MDIMTFLTAGAEDSDRNPRQPVSPVLSSTASPVRKLPGFFYYLFRPHSSEPYFSRANSFTLLFSSAAQLAGVSFQPS